MKLTFTLRTVVAQWIERSSDENAGRGFESRQRYAHQVVPRFVAWGHFAFKALRVSRRDLGEPRERFVAEFTLGF